MTQILLCTVGGSHQPIISAINDLRPDFVEFICTDKDPATNKPGSNTQIDGKGSCIKAQASDEKPTLPNIPTQTGLSTDHYHVTLTLADDLDRIYLDCIRVIDELTRRHPDAKINADYTGGTKSMSAGLVMAALEHPDVDLKLVTGTRGDLIKVQDGSQFADHADCQHIRYQRLSAPYRQAWSRYAYSEALAGLNNVRPPKGLRDEYTRLRELSRAFAEWDNFNHAQALTILQLYAPSMPESLKLYIAPSQRLNDSNPNKNKKERFFDRYQTALLCPDKTKANSLAKSEAARLFDLYLNAERRAAQGRYDDAVARSYRLIEWAAQWLLTTKASIDTGDIKPEQIPENMSFKPNREGIYQVGLYDAWQLVKLKTEGVSARFITEQQNTLLNHIKIRNNSILAHGFEPISANEWLEIHHWLERYFIPMLLAETAKVGIKNLPPQLPTSYQPFESEKTAD